MVDKGKDELGRIKLKDAESNADETKDDEVVVAGGEIGNGLVHRLGDGGGCAIFLC